MPLMDLYMNLCMVYIYIDRTMMTAPPLAIALFMDHLDIAELLIQWSQDLVPNREQKRSRIEIENRK